MKTKLLLFIIILFVSISCEKKFTCECKYYDKTTTHEVNAKNRYVAIGMCKSQDGKCHLKNRRNK